MIRSRTVNKIHELTAQGKSIQDIAIELGIARNTVRKYLRHPELCAMPHPRPNRRSKLDPFKEQVKKWIADLGSEKEAVWKEAYQELDYFDPDYELLITIRAVKPSLLTPATPV